MDYCVYRRVCAHKVECGEWTDVGICDYYGHYMRAANPKHQHLVGKRRCTYLRSKPTKAHLKMCETCKDRFICWTSAYWTEDTFDIHRWNVYHETVRKTREKTGITTQKDAKTRKKHWSHLSKRY